MMIIIMTTVVIIIAMTTEIVLMIMVLTCSSGRWSGRRWRVCGTRPGNEWLVCRY